MNDHDRKRSPLQIAAVHYASVIGLVLFFYLMSHLGDDDPSLVAVKLMAVPLWYLAFVGLRGIFKQPIVEERLTVRAVEHAVLHVLVTACMVNIMTYDPGSSLAETLQLGATLTAVILPLNLYFLIRDVRRERERRHAER